MTKAEARRIAARRRAERRAQRTDSFLVRARGAGLDLRRRLEGMGMVLLAFLARIATPLSAALFTLVKLGALAVLAISTRGTAAVRSLQARAGPARDGVWGWLLSKVRPIPTYAAVLAFAAIFLAISQFLHYHGVEVGSRYYEGRVGQVAPAPLTDLEVTGSAHLYVLLPVALLALILVVLTVRGRWQLGRVICALGVLGLVISVAADLPQALDAGRAGTAYDSANPELLEGFWIQVCCSALLVVFGPVLGARVRERLPHARARRRQVRLRGPERAPGSDRPGAIA